MVPIWATLLIACATTALGAYLKHQFDIRREKLGVPCMVVERFHRGFLQSPQAIADPRVELVVNNHAVHNAAYLVSRMKLRRGTHIRNIKVQVYPGDGNQVVDSQFWTVRQIMCRRLATLESPDGHLSYQIEYMNAGDTFDLVLMVAPCVNPELVDVQVDAEGLQVEARQLKLDCDPPHESSNCPQ